MWSSEFAVPESNSVILDCNRAGFGGPGPAALPPVLKFQEVLGIIRAEIPRNGCRLDFFQLTKVWPLGAAYGEFFPGQRRR